MEVRPRRFRPESVPTGEGLTSMEYYPANGPDVLNTVELPINGAALQTCHNRFAIRKGPGQRPENHTFAM